MTASMQLTLDGSEVEHRNVSRPAAAVPLSDAQVEILKWIALYGWISSTQAGVILHAHACDQWFAAHPQYDHPESRARYLGRRRPYAASDGGEALKRLAGRGLVGRVEPGAWRRAEDCW